MSAGFSQPSFVRQLCRIRERTDLQHSARPLESRDVGEAPGELVWRRAKLRKATRERAA
jgi:hypothetical protein